MERPRPTPPSRWFLRPQTLVIAAVVVLGGVMLGLLGRTLTTAGVPTSTASSPAGGLGTTGPSANATTASRPSLASPSTHPPTRSATPGPPDAAEVTLPVKGSGRDLGTEILLAPGPGGGVYVAIPQLDGVVVALLGNNGRSRPGWPVRLDGTTTCHLLLPVDKGSVRLACSGKQGSVDRVYALNENGRTSDGWPVEIDDAFAGRMVGEDLTMLVRPSLDAGGEEGDLLPVSVVVIEADATVRRGAEVRFPCCDSTWTLGPDGTAYGTSYRDWTSATSVRSDVLAFGFDGPRPGWPVTVEGIASELAFDAPGNAYLVVGSPTTAPTRTVVFDPGGRMLPAGSSPQDIVSSSPWNGAGADYPGAPVVAGDGTVFIVSTERDDTTVLALDPSGRPRAGWPYRSKLEMEWTGFCGNGDVGCGQMRTDPVVGAGNVLYVLQAASNRSSGGSIVAIKPDGQVRAGWPVGLRRSGSMFWSTVVATDGRLWAVAIEPETRGFSATILSIAKDSTVRSTTTIVEP